MAVVLELSWWYAKQDYQDVADLCTLDSEITGGLDMLSLVFGNHSSTDNEGTRTMVLQVHGKLCTLSIEVIELSGTPH
jgi:hypothetical protein